MPATINPRSRGTHEGGLLAARASAATVPGLRTGGYAWGLLRARMEERVLPPGGVERTRLVWQRCDSSRAADPCTFAGPMIICGRCWDTRHVFRGLTILGPLDAPLGVVCAGEDGCGGTDGEVSYALDPQYQQAIAYWQEWNAVALGPTGRKIR